MTSTGSQVIQYHRQTLHLHPFRAIFWQENAALLLADVHLGKVAHFRKAGIPVPQTAEDDNWDRLISLLLDFQPKRVLFLGDLFHSEYNPAWEELGNFIHQFNHISFELIPGNHDILFPDDYDRVGLKMQPPEYRLEPFILAHHPPAEGQQPETYLLAGHIHPAVRLQGTGRQRLRLPCFYFGKHFGLLPAFGSFTGLGEVKPQDGDQVYVIAEDTVVKITP